MTINIVVTRRIEYVMLLYTDGEKKISIVMWKRFPILSSKYINAHFEFEFEIVWLK